MAFILLAACSKTPVGTTPKDIGPSNVSTNAPTEGANLPEGPVEIELWNINEDILNAAIESKTLPVLFLSAWFTTTDFVHQGLVANITDVATTVKA